MNLKEIKELIKLMNDNQLGEVEVEFEGTKIKLKKIGTGFPVTVQSMPAMNIPMAPQASAAPAVPSAEVKAKSNLKEIKSPMVGTFYRAPSPEAPPYAEVGKIVEVGQVVCIVEAMKLMNEIKSDVKGKIVQISADNAQPVEFGQILFVIEPV